MTFDALVEAGARLLTEVGYAGMTTNEIARTAGVGIGSLYEYFPGKDAIVAQVAERLIERVMGRLRVHMTAILARPGRDAVERWITRVYETLADERDLVAAFAYEVPYTGRLPSVRALWSALWEFSEQARQAAGDRVVLEHPRASLHLLINLVSTTILQMVLEPPADVTTDEMLQAMSSKIEHWLTGGDSMRVSEG